MSLRVDLEALRDDVCDAFVDARPCGDRAARDETWIIDRIVRRVQDRLRLAAGWSLIDAPPTFTHCWVTNGYPDPAPDIQSPAPVVCGN